MKLEGIERDENVIICSQIFGVCKKKGQEKRKNKLILFVIFFYALIFTKYFKLGKTYDRKRQKEMFISPNEKSNKNIY
ncbi:hypothetical protein BpHYR1_034889 [Brachionus plicatilis]|uniref:Transmembrane protein n=1 Tax=Brachionus plicatilis TaxID=10195 RepID=A0A3M7TAQ2_BRAPC|nr:hypothetical protein BpHYR1_034889 [Brachionus plicatilis]